MEDCPSGEDIVSFLAIGMSSVVFLSYAFVHGQRYFNWRPLPGDNHKNQRDFLAFSNIKYRVKPHGCIVNLQELTGIASKKMTVMAAEKAKKSL